MSLGMSLDAGPTQHASFHAPFRLPVRFIRRTWDLDPNGTGLVVLTGVDAAGPIRQGHEIVFLQHFGDYFRALVPDRQ
jgi:hypothetical protein